MLVKVKKRKTSVLGTPLFKGTQLEISEEQYDMYKDEFDLIEKSNTPKTKKTISNTNNKKIDLE